MIYVSLLLDFVLIGLLAAGISYAMKLTRQLADMRSSRADMERFVIDFNSTVTRAEAGVRGLKTASRNVGDDLEKLIEKGTMLRDEMNFLIESADQMATRLSTAASGVARTAAAQPETKTAPAAQAKPASQPVKASAPAPVKLRPAPEPTPASSAERDLLRALGQIGGGRS